MSTRVASRSLALLGAAAIAMAAVAFSVALPTLGRNIPQPHIETDYLIALCWAALLGLSIYIWPVSADDKRALLVLWGAKCFVTLGFMLVYEWNYPLDAYAYFTEGERLRGTSLMGRLGIGTGTSNIVGISSLVSSIVPGSYHALKVSFAMIGLLGIYLIYRGTVRFLGRSDERILYAIGLFPSVLFWSSILGKDPLQFFGIALYVYGVIAWTRTGGWRFVLAIAAGIFIAASMRTWSGPILLAPLAFILVRRGPFPVRRGIATIIGVLALTLAWSRFADQFRVETVEDLVSRAEGLSRGWEEGGSTLRTAATFTDVPSMLANIPAGVTTALFRPLPGEVPNAFGMIAGMENLLIVFLVLRAIARARWNRFRDPIVRWAVALVLVWSTVYGFTAYNLGSMARFKLQILPILLLVLLYLGRKRDAEDQIVMVPEPIAVN